MTGVHLLPADDSVVLQHRFGPFIALCGELVDERAPSRVTTPRGELHTNHMSASSGRGLTGVMVRGVQAVVRADSEIASPFAIRVSVGG